VFVGRGKETIQRMFSGTEPAEPGVVVFSYWRPDSGQPDYNADQVWGYCGVAQV
jgi:S-adenosyl methyltransferase